ncbi:hypothetical protein ASG75_06380 [Rhodanobacter sp. Soil772]|uniref:hypothetical protein n=1 Tax=Rhodanobacter sp. Soil772 TaxID=1736406 RepID=UPI0006F50FD9|nr:hypothetical protein [Rhodanobacter sp. Soil772]KRE87738.1 hypothetical protein ASG75_06380 [Rhodanobacter sp. Soil772]
MMPSTNRPIAPPMPTTAFMPLAVDACDAVNDTVTPPHADYNLRPLAVDSLDHYVIRLDEYERFHVV